MDQNTKIQIVNYLDNQFGSDELDIFDYLYQNDLDSVAMQIYYDIGIPVNSVRQALDDLFYNYKHSLREIITDWINE